MERQQLNELIEKFLNGSANEVEKQRLTDWYNQTNEQEVIWEGDSVDEKILVYKRMLDKIRQHVHVSKTPVVPIYRKYLYRVAAVFIGFTVISGVYLFVNRKVPLTQSVKTASVVAQSKLIENKYLTLPDSSTVILHPGSKLHYTFNGKTRVVTLDGEAYFDVRHIASQPFIIHSGNVITTVLGTAFNISAYPGKKVTVSVKRGKVSVADMGNHILAVLTPDQQLIYSSETHTSNEQQVQTQKTIEWVSSDVQFSAVPFKELAEKLSVRYSVMIKFEDEALESYSITGRFSGTESLKVLLTALCETSSSAYKIDGNTVTIFKTNN